MTVDLVIRNARVINHTGEFEGGVAVEDGRIAVAGTNDMLPRGRREIDAEGLVMMPGVVDPHCHLGVRYPFEDDMRTETAAAVAGGVTTILIYGRTLKGSYSSYYDERRAIGEQSSCIDFGFHFVVQNEDHIREIPKIAEKTGIASYKLYFGYEPDNPIGIVPATDGWVYAAMRILAKIPGGILSVHCENTGIASWLKHEIQATGRQDLAAYTESRPSLCEIETIKRMIFLAERTQCPLYVVHTSVGEGPTLGAEARRRGIDVTIETCPHYLTRTAYDDGLDMRAKISPPLRDRTEQEGLWRGVFDGGVGTLGSDHVPFLPKKGENLWTEFPGAVGFAWELPLLLSEGVHRRGLSLSRLVALNSYAPACRFGLWPQKGSLEAGGDADLVLVDLDEERIINHTGKGHCIYEGMRLRGWPRMTIARGRVIYEAGVVDPAAFGRGACVTRAR